ncbi:MAG: leucine-rich repeat domain-containing protein [Oscillospiraceae bacterium]|nr:leucine-rich repeat domain-containing protein [Oscillospiraceae bacterium]
MIKVEVSENKVTVKLLFNNMSFIVENGVFFVDGTILDEGSYVENDADRAEMEKIEGWGVDHPVNEIVFSDNVSEINLEFSVFYLKNVERVILGKNVTVIGDNVFPDLKITEIAFPDSLVSIGSGAFKSCDLLEKVVIPSNVEILKDTSFVDCTLLNDITILSKDIEIGKDAFSINSDTSVNSERIIRGYTGSTAETYANENGFTFIPLDEPVTEVTTSATEEVITESTTTQPVTTDSVTQQSQSTVITDAASAKVNSTPKTGEKNIYGIIALGISAAVLSVVSSAKKQNRDN